MNPFTPSFGTVPVIMGGRDGLLSDIEKAIEGKSNDPNLTTIIVGPRGSGKTALLTQISDFASTRGWIAVNTTCISGMLDDILEQTQAACRKIFDIRTGKRLKAVNIGTVGVEWDNPQREDGDAGGSWRLKMSEMLDRLTEYDGGILITVDEVDPKLSEMITLAAVYQHFVREKRRVALFMAGLPYRVSMLLKDESVSFLRRTQYRYLENLAKESTEMSIKLTVEEGGRTIDPDALEYMVRKSLGFPYMMQLIGYRTWEHTDASVISMDDAIYGAARAENEITERIYRITYMELSQGDINFLIAMLDDTGASKISDITKRLDRTTSYIAQYRRRLLMSGVIREKSRGRVEFALPGFRAFLKDEELLQE